MRVCVVDDHPLVLEGICAVLGRRGHTVECAKDIPQAAELLTRQPRFDILLLDYQLPSGKGSALLGIEGVNIPRHVVVLSALTDPDDICYALEETGAIAYILKHIDLDDLDTALEQVTALPKLANGGYIWDIDEHHFVAPEKAFAPGSLLSPREREVLMLLRKGLTDKQIADALTRSIHTIRVQIRAVKRKRGHTRRAESSL